MPQGLIAKLRKYSVLDALFFCLFTWGTGLCLSFGNNKFSPELADFRYLFGEGSSCGECVRFRSLCPTVDCSVVNFLQFETVSDESLGGVLPFAI